MSHSLHGLKAQGLLRQLKILQGIDLTSNDVLRLSRHEKVRKKIITALKRGTPLGAGGSRLLGGHHRQHQEVEEFLAQTFRREAALIYGSGYLANIGVITALFKDAHIFSDKLNHASLIDGIRLAKMRPQIYPHNNMEVLEEYLSQSRAKKKVIISESLFSMTGDFAPVERICQLAQKYHAWIFIDEAHATGIYGHRGLGLVDEINIKNDPRVISMHTMGKAFGGQGAFVLSSAEIKEILINTSRSFIYTTAPSPLTMVQWMATFSVWRETPQLREKLFKVMNWWGGDKCKSHIVPIPISGNREVVAKAKGLEKRNFAVMPIRYPTVAKGEERIRISLNIELTEEQVEEVKQIIDKINI